MHDKSKAVAIIGHGNQAKAWRENLIDSGREVALFLRSEGSSYSNAKENKLDHVFSFNDQESFSRYDTFVMLTPDHLHKEILALISKNIKKGSTLIFAHGYSLYRDQLAELYPELNFVLLAPKAIATELRKNYALKKGNAAVYSVELALDKKYSLELIKALAADLGITSGPFEVTIKEETQADLFSEQSILCSILPYSALTAYNCLVEKGVSKELAFFECWHEVKLIANTMIDLGPEKFFDLISPNALIGAKKGHELIFDQNLKEKFSKLYTEIENATFDHEIEKAKVEDIRDEMKTFWKSQDLSKTHERLKNELY